MLTRDCPNCEEIAAKNRGLRILVDEFDQNQIMRIQDNSSKTRLSILFYSLAWDSLKIAEQTTQLLTVFRECWEIENSRESSPPEPIESELEPAT